MGEFLHITPSLGYVAIHPLGIHLQENQETGLWSETNQAFFAGWPRLVNTQCGIRNTHPSRSDAPRLRFPAALPLLD